jgi:hypothetical protein
MGATVEDCDTSEPGYRSSAMLRGLVTLTMNAPSSAGDDSDPSFGGR